LLSKQRDGVAEYVGQASEASRAATSG
jgi:hypothetical protein